MPELLIGCGNDRRKKLWHANGSHEWSWVTTLDIDPACSPDVLWDLNHYPYPFSSDHFDEIHAYEVLEHCGAQGDWKFFFHQFSEFWRILKPGGHFFGSVPDIASPWVWADPGHRRVIDARTLVFLSQAQYKQQVGKTTMTDYRAWYKADFEIVWTEVQDNTLGFVLKSIKGN